MNDDDRIARLRQQFESSAEYEAMRRELGFIRGLLPDRLLDYLEWNNGALAGEIGSWGEDLANQDQAASLFGTAPEAPVIREAGKVRILERDYYLGLHDDPWPQVRPEGWEADFPVGPETAYLFRRVQGEREEFLEYIIRMPSAPIYGVHRRDDYNLKLDRPNYHTFRLFVRPTANGRTRRIKRVYLFCNGLNEIDRVTHYYRLADALLTRDTACVLRPFPGHLTRFPLASAFAEQPLDRYLADASDLYRQYLRYMLETQWLLSMLVPSRSYRVIAGLDLLAEGDNEKPGRDDPGTLAQAIHAEWLAAFSASLADERDAGKVIRPEAIESTIRSVRKLIGWRSWQAEPENAGAAQRKRRTSLDAAPTRSNLTPALHVVGYSLGGNVAQSIFFTWPFAVSSCTSLCSGAALRDIELGKFADPEEWHTVMHALRYEIESAMVETRLRRSAERIAGVKADYFRYINHIFFEVFLQDFRGSYRSRVSEYLSRLLFIVGGADPIISIQSVHDAVGEGRVHELPVPQLGHDIWTEREWRKLSQAGAIRHLVFFSRNAERLLAASVASNWWNKDRTKLVSSRGRRRSRKEDVEEEVSTSEFQSSLDYVIRRLYKDGWLHVSRNNLPIALLGPLMLHLDGAALYHSDSSIREYVVTLQKRGELINQVQERITLILPAQLKKWFQEKPPVLSGNVETAGGGKLPTAEQLAAIWGEFYARWKGTGSLREFEPSLGGRLGDHELMLYARKALGGLLSNVPVVNTLPDVWLYFSNEVVEVLKGWSPEPSTCRDMVEEGFARWAANLHSSGTAKQIGRWLKDESILAIKVSAAEFNPRYMGERIWSERAVRDLLVHAALCQLHSERV